MPRPALRLGVFAAVSMFISSLFPTGTQGAAPYSTEPNTALLYHLDETSGTVADDAAGTRNATYGSAVTHPASQHRFVNAAQATGSITTGRIVYVDSAGTSSFLYPAADFTIEAWVKHAGSNPTNSFQTIAAAAPTGQLGKRDWAISVSNDGKLIFSTHNDGQTGDFTLQSAVLTWDPNTWYHVAMVVDDWGVGGNVKLYRTPAGTTTPTKVADANMALLTGHSHTANRELSIGNYNIDSGKRYWTGRIDEVRFSTVARSESDLQKTLGSNGIALGTLALTATYNSIGIELPYTYDDNDDSTATVQYRPTGGGWKPALDLWRIGSPTDEGTRAFYGSVCLLTHNTSYEILVTVTDPNGGGTTRSGTITTRNDNVPSIYGLSATHYVKAIYGNDNNDGLTWATAWKTIDKAMTDAPPGAVVRIGGGYYTSSYTTSSPRRDKPITLIGDWAPVDGGGNVIHAGAHTVIEPPAISQPGENKWVQVNLNGYTVWKWANCPVNGVTCVGFASTRAAAPKRVAYWKTDGAALATPAGWAQMLYTNLTYNYGAYSSGYDVYLRLPGDVNPNTQYITMGNNIGLPFSGDDIRVYGLEIRGFINALDFNHTADRAIVQYNYLPFNGAGVYLRSLTWAPYTSGADHTIQYNLISDTSLWSTVAGDAIPWVFIKDQIYDSNGNEYATAKIGASAETCAINGRGFARRVVIRNNTIDGCFNGIAPGYNAGLGRYVAQDCDVTANTLRNIADDAFEPEYGVINFRCWNNKVHNTLTVLSTGPLNYGPLYFFRNEAWRTGNHGVGADHQGVKPGTLAFKYSGTSNPTARVFVVNNTFWTDRASVLGGARYASVGTSYESFWLRNNLFRVTHYAFDAFGAPAYWDEAHNHFSTVDQVRGLKYNSISYTNNVAAYRTASGQGTGTNVAGNFVMASLVDSALNNPTGGILTLKSSAPFRDAGTPVPNLTNTHNGPAPDIGRYEY